jgi:hypothetical protein
MKQYDNANNSYYVTANTILSLAQRAEEIFESSEPEEKRQLLNFLFLNLKMSGKNLQYSLKAPFEGVLLATNSLNWGRLCEVFGTIDWHQITEELAVFQKSFNFCHNLA